MIVSAKDSNTGTKDNETPDDAEDPEYPVEPTSEQDEREEGRYSPEHANHEDSEDSNYMPESEDDVSLGDEDFIVQEEPLEQERFKRQLIATARSLKKKQQQLKVEHDTLNERWTKVLAAEEYGHERPKKVTPSASCCHDSTTKPLSQYRRNTIRQINQIEHHVDGIKRHIKPNTNPHPLAEEAGRQQPRDIHVACNVT